MYILYCIAGLGNPGTQYEQTRHNAGFLVIDQVALQFKINLNQKGFQSIWGKGIINHQQVFLMKPQTYMNLSGEAVLAMVSYYKIPFNQVLIVYDDLDLPLGKIRFRLSGGAGGHKGLSSVINTIGISDIPRLRVGIGRPKNEEAIVDYVLAPFTGEEQADFKCAVERAAGAVQSFVIENPEYVMNHFN